MSKYKASMGDIKVLRERTGAGIKDCKTALVETLGDYEAAIDWLRTKGMAKAAKKSGRIASEGRIYSSIKEGNAVIVEINCETDFVARTADFQSFVDEIAAHILVHKPSSIDELLTQSWHDGGDVSAALQNMVVKTGENVKVRRYELFVGDGLLHSYIHTGDRLGVILEIGSKGDSLDMLDSAGNKVGGLSGEMTDVDGDGDIDSITQHSSKSPQIDEIIDFAEDLAMHIVASRPDYISAADIPTAILEKETDIQKARLKEDEKNKNKPENIIDKIVIGRINNWKKEISLFDQAWIHDEKGKQKVSSVIKELGQKVGDQINVRRFATFELGEGIEKKVSNLADEVAAMSAGK
jgi:elongation factor Ts